MWVSCRRSLQLWHGRQLLRPTGFQWERCGCGCIAELASASQPTASAGKHEQQHAYPPYPYATQNFMAPSHSLFPPPARPYLTVTAAGLPSMGRGSIALEENSATPAAALHAVNSEGGSRRLQFVRSVTKGSRLKKRKLPASHKMEAEFRENVMVRCARAGPSTQSYIN